MRQSAACRREMARCQTAVEEVFPSLDRLGWAKSRPKGLWKSLPPEKSGVDCKGFMASIAHNVLKAVRRLSLGIGPHGLYALADYTQFLQSRDSDKPSAGLPHPVRPLR